MFIGQFARANELDEWIHTGVKYSQRPLRSLHGNMRTLTVYMNARNEDQCNTYGKLVWMKLVRGASL